MKHANVNDQKATHGAILLLMYLYTFKCVHSKSRILTATHRGLAQTTCLLDSFVFCTDGDIY